MAPRTDSPVVRHRLPSGAPLFLERPGSVAQHLRPFITKERYTRLSDVLDRRTRRLTSFLENVFDAHNLSACMRSSEAFGLQDIHVIPQEGLDLRFSNDVSSGSHRWLSPIMYGSIDEAIAGLREGGYRIIATDLQECDRQLDLDEVPLDQKLVVAFGGEHEGISQRLRDEADATLALPMYGFVQSFNISVAFALVMHRLRQRQLERGASEGDLGAEQKLSLLDRWIFEDVPKSREILEELRRRA